MRVDDLEWSFESWDKKHHAGLESHRLHALMTANLLWCSNCYLRIEPRPEPLGPKWAWQVGDDVGEWQEGRALPLCKDDDAESK